MELNEINIENIIKSVMWEIKKEENISEETGIYSNVEDATHAAREAYIKFRNYSMEDREKIIKSIRIEVLNNLEAIAKLAWEETGMGRYEDKINKNKLAAEKTPGTEDLMTYAYTGDNGLTLVELSPFGVIASITPSTNPTETVISNAIGMIAAGNSVVFCPHPNAKKSTINIIKIINTAIKKAGGPDNLICTLGNPKMADAGELMKDKEINMVVATGGPGLVKLALSSGKKTIGAGAGNPPTVVDETADIEQAAKDIVNGASFDNNLPCIAEKEVIVVDSVADYLIFNMKNNKAHLIDNENEKKQLEKLLIGENGTANKEYIGKNPEYILSKIGINPEKGTKLIILETNENHPFVQEELMMPVLPIVRVSNVEEAIKLAVKVEHGNRHTATMHSKNVDNLSKCAKELQTTIFVKNAPSYAGIGFYGEGHTTFTIAGPTGEGLTSAQSFARKRRCVLAGSFSIR